MVLLFDHSFRIWPIRCWGYTRISYSQSLHVPPLNVFYPVSTFATLKSDSVIAWTIMWRSELPNFGNESSFDRWSLECRKSVARPPGENSWQAALDSGLAGPAWAGPAARQASHPFRPSLGVALRCSAFNSLPSRHDATWKPVEESRGGANSVLPSTASPPPLRRRSERT